MFVRKKQNKSGLVSVQVIDKSRNSYRVVMTIGSSRNASQIASFVKEGEAYIRKYRGVVELDFDDRAINYEEILSTIIGHRMVGVELVLGKIFDEIGFNQIKDDLFRDLTLYRLTYPKSKLKTVEYLYRYEGKSYSEDEVYRYMDKLHKTQKEQVQQISYAHTLRVLENDLRFVFYDVTTLYFEVDKEDDLRKTGFSKEGKHQHPQIVLGLLVSEGGYPFAYEIFEGNKFEGHTMLPVLEAFREKYKIEKLTVVADSGLLSSANLNQLQEKGYEFVLGARIKAESRDVKEQILALKLKEGQNGVVEKDGLRLIITYSEKRAQKDRYNRDKGVRRLQELIAKGKLTKAQVNKRGYNKFLEMEGEVLLRIDKNKIEDDQKWDGLKGYLTNSQLEVGKILDSYQQLWQIEKAFRVTKTDLKIRPIFHYKKRRIEAHICLNFVAFKVYKELERQLKTKKSTLSPEKVIEIIQNVYEITLNTPDKNIIRHLIILSEEQKYVQKLFGF